MLDSLAPGVLLQGGAVGILALVALMVFTGKLVARSVLKDVREDRDARLGEMKERLDEMRTINNTWHEAYLKSEAARLEATAQVSQLLTMGRIAEALLRALPHPDDTPPPQSPTRELTP